MSRMFSRNCMNCSGSGIKTEFASGYGLHSRCRSCNGTGMINIPDAIPSRKTRKRKNSMSRQLKMLISSIFTIIKLMLTMFFMVSSVLIIMWVIFMLLFFSVCDML